MARRSTPSKIWGFTRDEWVRSGAFTTAQVNAWVATITAGLPVDVSYDDLLRMARVSSRNAKKVWRVMQKQGASTTHAVSSMIQGARPGEQLERMTERVQQIREEIRRLASGE